MGECRAHRCRLLLWWLTGGSQSTLQVTPVHILARSTATLPIARVALVLEPFLGDGMDCGIVDSGGDTPLHDAAVYRYAAVVNQSVPPASGGVLSGMVIARVLAATWASSTLSAANYSAFGLT